MVGGVGKVGVGGVVGPVGIGLGVGSKNEGLLLVKLPGPLGGIRG